MRQVFTLLAFTMASAFLFTSCGDELSDQLVGTWTGISWTVEGKEKPNSDKVKFVFNGDKTYEANYGVGGETGTFRVFGRNLYTTAEGKLEKLVKFDFDEDLNLIFAMNRVGTSERIVMQKQAKARVKGK